MQLDAQLVMQACVKNKPKELEVLLNKGAPIVCEDECRRTPLHVAAWFASGECVEVLLRHGANAGLEDDNGDTAMWIATRRNASAIMAQLLADGCKPNTAHPRTGRRLLDLAVEADPDGTSSVALLLNAGADPRAKNGDGTTAYSRARDQRSCSFSRIAEAAVASLFVR